MAAEKVHAPGNVEHAARQHNESRRQELNERLKRWGIMGGGGFIAAWVGYGLLLINNPVTIAAGLAVGLGGLALTAAGLIMGAGNLISRIRKKNRS